MLTSVKSQDNHPLSLLYGSFPVIAAVEEREEVLQFLYSFFKCWKITPDFLNT